MRRQLKSEEKENEIHVQPERTPIRPIHRFCVFGVIENTVSYSFSVCRNVSIPTAPFPIPANPLVAQNNCFRG